MSGPDYSVFIIYIYFFFQFLMFHKMYLAYPQRRPLVPQVEDHVLKTFSSFNFRIRNLQMNKISKEQCRINVYSC
jgi:hypothetical protein